MGSLEVLHEGLSLPGGISPADQELISQWNKSEDVLMNCCLHEIVERQAQLTPDNVAVCAWDGCLSYGELDRMSSRFATYLTEVGIKPQDFVLFLHEKSRLAPVIITAILKAGECFLLDKPERC
jgi:non-ribosomal peptide synthetase component F